MHWFCMQVRPEGCGVPGRLRQLWNKQPSQASRGFAVCSPSDAESERFTAPIYTFFGGISWLRRPGICSEDSRHAGQSNYCTLDMGWFIKSPFCEAFTGFVLGVETAFHSSKLKRAMPESKSAMGNPRLKIQVPQATVFSSPQRIAQLQSEPENHASLAPVLRVPLSNETHLW